MHSRRLAFCALFSLGNLLFPCALTAVENQPGPTVKIAAPIDVARYEALLQQSRRVEANNTKHAVELAREALALTQKMPGNDYLPELRARVRLGEALRLASQYPEALSVVQAGLAFPSTPATGLERANLQLNLAQIHWNTGDYALAEAEILVALQQAEALNNPRLLIRILSLRGILARRQNQLELAIEHLRRGLALTLTADEPELRAQLRNNLANALVDSGELVESRALLEENLRYRTETGDRRSLANALLNLGSLHGKASEHETALDYYQRALAIRRELGVPRQIASAQISVALSLTRLGRTDEALALLREAAPLAIKVDSQDVSANLYSQFAMTHAAREEFREALDYQRKAEAEKASMASAETSRTIAELRERFDAEKRSREIAELRTDKREKAAALALQDAELSRARLQRYALGGLLILGGLAVTAVISRQRAVARAERLILAETRAARDAAEDANQLKTKLLDLASHDLKAPLVGMMMTADILLDESGDRAEIVKPAQAIRAESERMLTFVQDLLDGSAAEAKRIPLAIEPVALNALIDGVVTTFHPRTARKQQRVHFTAALEPLTLSADPARLQQVVENLVDNALKFSPAGSTVYVSTRRAHDRVQLLVRDEGPGLSAADQTKLFQRFTRLSATPTGGESSSGLGLSLVRDLVQLHGGKIWVESTPGQGATFIAEFPASAA